MLEFVYRTYTDEQLPAVVRDPSTELVDLMSESLDKDNFITPSPDIYYYRNKMEFAFGTDENLNAYY